MTINDKDKQDEIKDLGGGAKTLRIPLGRLRRNGWENGEL
jgi:hypothetical protein